MDDDGQPTDPSGSAAPAASGPLDELRPELRQTPESPVPVEPVHRRVLRVDAEDGVSLVLACWSDPGGHVQLHHALRPRIEGALLASVTRPPSLPGEDVHDPHWLRLACFTEVPGDVPAAVRAFALDRVDPRGTGWRQAVAHLRSEAQRAGVGILDEPATCWEARVAGFDEPHGSWLQQLETELAAQTRDEPWGKHPGAPWRRLLQTLEGHGFNVHGPSLQVVRRIEPHLIPDTENVIRWIPPTVLQALCDGVGVAASVDLGREVQWALCEPDDSGMPPPPMMRIARDRGYEHVPVGLALVRWCVIPKQPGEQVPSLADWIADQFGPR